MLALLLLAHGFSRAAEVRLHVAERIFGHGLGIESSGWEPRPTLDQFGDTTVKLRAPWLLANVEANSDPGRNWHLYADYTRTRREGHGLVTVQRNLYGLLPIRVGIPAEFSLDLDTLLLGVGCRLGENDHQDWGATAGLQHVAGRISGAPTTGPDRRDQSAAGRMTLPTLGFFWRGRISDRVAVTARYAGTVLAIRMNGRELAANHLRLGIESKVEGPLSIGVGLLRSDFRWQTREPAYHSRYAYAMTMGSVYIKFDF